MEFLHWLFSYEGLRLIWWLFLGVLLIGFAIMDGFDLGVAALLPLVAHSDDERRVLLNSIGPTWEGNQVWFILGGGAIFAAYPLIYSAAFSGLFMALILTLFALIMRPVGFDYRSKLSDPRWRQFWDWGMVVGGVVPAVVFGVAFGNLLHGLPFQFDADLRVYYHGWFIALLDPFSLVCGVVSLAMLMLQGAAFLQLKTEGVLQQRAQYWGRYAAFASVGGLLLAGLWVAFGMDGYKLVQFAGTDAPSNPLTKTVVRESGAWLSNYRAQPLLWLIPLAACGLPFAVLGCWKLKQALLGWLCSSLAIAATILTAGVALFPFLMPSSLDPNHSLTLWDATSSRHTLLWMFWMALLFLPLIIAYTSWVFYVLRGRVTVEQIQQHGQHLY